MATPRYLQGEAARLTCDLVDEDTAAADPAANALTIYIADPANTTKIGTEDGAGAAVTRDGTGDYHYDYTIPTDAVPGLWRVLWKAIDTGPLPNFGRDTFLVVERTTGVS